MSDIRDAGPRMRQMNDVLEDNERLRGRLAWTERERDSLRRSIKNLAEYIAELNDEIERLGGAILPQPYEKDDEKRGDLCTKRGATPPRNGALSGCETVPDTDSRVWETPCTPQPQATPTQGSVQGEGSVPCSRTENEPVAWAVYWNECDSPLLHDELPSLAGMDPRPRVVPLYSAPHVDRVVRLPRLSIWERDAVFEALDTAGVRWDVER